MRSFRASLTHTPRLTCPIPLHEFTHPPTSPASLAAVGHNSTIMKREFEALLVVYAVGVSVATAWICVHANEQRAKQPSAAADSEDSPDVHHHRYDLPWVPDVLRRKWYLKPVYPVAVLLPAVFWPLVVAGFFLAGAGWLLWSAVEVLSPDGAPWMTRFHDVRDDAWAASDNTTADVVLEISGAIVDELPVPASQPHTGSSKSDKTAICTSSMHSCQSLPAYKA